MNSGPARRRPVPANIVLKNPVFFSLTCGRLRGLCIKEFAPALAEGIFDSSRLCFEKKLKKGPGPVFLVRPLHPDTAGMGKVVIKECRPRTFFSFLCSPFILSKARRNLRAAVWLGEAGLATPQPLAALDLKWGPFVRTGYYIASALDPSHKCRTLLRKKLLSGDQMRRVVCRSAGYAARMHAAGLQHGDLHPGNFLLTPDNQLHLIDLSRMRRKHPGPLARIHDIGRMYWREYRQLFFDTYCETCPRLKKYRWLFNGYLWWRRKRKKVKMRLQRKR